MANQAILHKNADLGMLNVWQERPYCLGMCIDLLKPQARPQRKGTQLVFRNKTRLRGTHALHEEKQVTENTDSVIIVCVQYIVCIYTVTIVGTSSQICNKEVGRACGRV